MIGVVQDVTKDMLEKIQIKNERDLDPLTKLYNRKAFQKLVEHKYKDNYLSVTSLIMFDLDNLKHINDNYGHKWGDIYIVEAVARLKELGRSDNVILSRRSGDEFAVFLFGYDSRKEIIDEIEEFYEYLVKTPLELPNGTKREISMSGGVTWLLDKELNYDEMIHLADKELYRAKNYNKGRYEISKL